jgi:hypothetical protein
MEKFYGRHHNLLTITKYPYLKWQWIFYFLRRCFLSSITATTFTDLTVYMGNPPSVLLEAGTAYPFRALEFTPYTHRLFNAI